MYSKYYPFSGVKLPYSYNELEPFIGEHTVFFHYNNHYIESLEKLNDMVLEIPLWQNIPLELLTKNPDKKLRETSGTVYNHELYFSGLSPEKNSPSGNMKAKIEVDFGSMEDFLSEMKNAALELFGSGYIFLVLDNNLRLHIISSQNQDTPDFEKYYPIFAIDLWEHAYYLDRLNEKDLYVDAVLNLINWKAIEENYNSVYKYNVLNK